VLVRCLQDGKYQLVAGERRWRAAKIAGLQTIPALVSAYDDLAALEVGLIENMAREDLNPVEEARACATLAKELGLTHQQIGERVGRSTSAVANLVRLLNLSDEILEPMDRGELGQAHGLALLRAKDPQAHRQLAHKAVQEGWSVRTLRARADQSNSAGSAPEDAVPAQRQTPGQQEHDLEAVAMNVARVWGDLLGAEVSVRTLRGRKLRLEVVFNPPESAFVIAGRLGEAVARGSKRK